MIFFNHDNFNRGIDNPKTNPRQSDISSAVFGFPDKLKATSSAAISNFRVSRRGNKFKEHDFKTSKREGEQDSRTVSICIE